MEILIGTREKDIKKKVNFFIGSVSKLSFPSDSFNICIQNLEETKNFVDYEIKGIEVLYKSEGTLWTCNAEVIFKVNKDGYGDIHFYKDYNDDIVYLSADDAKDLLFKAIKEYTFLFK